MALTENESRPMLSSDLYLSVRDKEGRLFSDDIVRRLPALPAAHPLHSEWRLRALSARRLLHYVDGLPRPLRMLEVGCGNGWLSHQLSSLSDVETWGLDLRGPELEQAARLFTGGRTGFLSADVFHPPFAPTSIDLIVVASSIQYFPDLPALIRCLRGLLSERGELHVMDSPLYEESELPAARERTRLYYEQLGVPEMARHYFHHTFSELREFSPRWLYRPGGIKMRLSKLAGRSESPFAWFAIGAPGRMPK